MLKCVFVSAYLENVGDCLFYFLVSKVCLLFVFLKCLHPNEEKNLKSTVEIGCRIAKEVFSSWNESDKNCTSI